MTSESTRFLGQPNEIKPTVGAVGVDDSLVTLLLYGQVNFCADLNPFAWIEVGVRKMRV